MPMRGCLPHKLHNGSKNNKNRRSSKTNQLFLYFEAHKKLIPACKSPPSSARPSPFFPHSIEFYPPRPPFFHSPSPLPSRLFTLPSLPSRTPFSPPWCPFLASLSPPSLLLRVSFAPLPLRSLCVQGLMMIRNRTTKTARRSPLNSRGSERPTEQQVEEECTLRGCRTYLKGDPFRVGVLAPGVRGCSLRSSPRLLTGDRLAVLAAASIRIIGFVFLLALMHSSLIACAFFSHCRHLFLSLPTHSSLIAGAFFSHCRRILFCMRKPSSFLGAYFSFSWHFFILVCPLCYNKLPILL